jgi:hypothetical protein
MPLCTVPSLHVSDQGGAPVSAAESVAERPAQIVVVPLTVAETALPTVTLAVAETVTEDWLQFPADVSMRGVNAPADAYVCGTLVHDVGEAREAFGMLIGVEEPSPNASVPDEAIRNVVLDTQTSSFTDSPGFAVAGVAVSVTRGWNVDARTVCEPPGAPGTETALPPGTGHRSEIFE